ncbi:MAG: hypothetical protein HC831_11520 [Chloroflexia bacterium]|nr:hypothetical protein [Chloroflexia bacterium]
MEVFNPVPHAAVSYTDRNILLKLSLSVRKDVIINDTKKFDEDYYNLHEIMAFIKGVFIETLDLFQFILNTSNKNL